VYIFTVCTLHQGAIRSSRRVQLTVHLGQRLLSTSFTAPTPTTKLTIPRLPRQVLNRAVLWTKVAIQRFGEKVEHDMAQGLERSRSRAPPAAPVRPARTARRAGGKRAVEERRHCDDASPPLVFKIHVNSCVSEALRTAVDQWTGESTYDRAPNAGRPVIFCGQIAEYARMGRHGAGIWLQSVFVRHALRPPLTQLRVSCAAQVAQ
jgi:hypothetical protein